MVCTRLQVGIISIPIAGAHVSSPLHHSLNLVSRKHYQHTSQTKSRLDPAQSCLGRAFLNSALCNPLPQFPSPCCTVVWTLVLGSTELGGTGAHIQLTCPLTPQISRGGRGRWPQAGQPQATGATGRAQGPAPGTWRGSCHTKWDLLFAEGSQQTQPPPAPCLPRAAAAPWRAQPTGACVSSCHCWRKKW